MKKYLYLILCIFLLSCGGKTRSTNEAIPNVVVTNEELAFEAEKTAPWKNEPIVEFASDEEIKEFLVLIDQIRNDFGKTIRTKMYKIETFKYEKEYVGEISGEANFKLEITNDDIFDDAYDDQYKGAFDFHGFQNIAYAIHGTLKYEKNSIFGPGYSYSVDTIDGGVSYKNELGVHIISIHLVKKEDDPSIDDHSNTYTGSLNGKEIFGQLPY